MRKLKIDAETFALAFSRDTGFEEPDMDAYLDTQKGEVRWIYREDSMAGDFCSPEENRPDREEIEGNPDRYVKIPGRTHAQVHHRLIDFLESKGEDSPDAEDGGWGHYDGSIGRWKETAGPGAYNCFQEYCRQKALEEGASLLRSNGIVPEWV